MQIRLRNPPRDLGGYEFRAFFNSLLRSAHQVDDKNLLTLVSPVVTFRADEFIRQRLSGDQRSRY